MRPYIHIVVMLIISLNLTLGQGRKVDVQVTATVDPTIEMITLANIDVGTVVPSEDLLKVDPRKDQGAGLILVTGRPRAEIQISFTDYVEMRNAASDIPLDVYYSISGNTENNQSASQIFTENPINVNISPAGEYYIWIGCEFSLKNLVAGSYDGDFVIDVEFTQ